MNTIAVIIGRANSRGVPGKNAMTIARKPCAQWAVEDALAARTLSAVVVSSDDDQLQRTAEALGVWFVRRPDHLATSTARVDDAVRHALEAVDSAGRFDAAAVLYANVPVRPAGLIDRAVTLLHETACHSVQSYCNVGKHHPWWTVRLGEAGRVRAWNGGELNHGVHRRQDLPPAFVPDGGVLAVRRKALFDERARAEGSGPHAFLGDDRRGVETEPGEVIDIDSPIDAVVAETVLRERIARIGGQAA